MLRHIMYLLEKQPVGHKMSRQLYFPNFKAIN